MKKRKAYLFLGKKTSDLEKPNKPNYIGSLINNFSNVNEESAIEEDTEVEIGIEEIIEESTV